MPVIRGYQRRQGGDVVTDMATFSLRVGALLVALAPLVATAAGEPTVPLPAPGAKPTRGALMDYGAFLTSSLSLPPSSAKEKIPPAIAYKSVNIKLGNGTNVAFDMDLMRYAAGWTGDWLNLSSTHMTTQKGEVCPSVG